MAKIARFGVFELNLRTGELRKQGVKLKLQGQAFRLLRALLERPGHVVAREELCQRLWTPGVFVDAESGLNTAANRLRIALGESADHPRYIETLARTGYRFIAPVEIAESETASLEATSRPLRIWRRSAAVAAASIGGLAIAVSVTVVAFRHSPAPAFQFRQVTFR